MVDIEMLKRGLRCIAGIDREDLCHGCRYGQINEECDVSIAKDALAMLEEMDSVEHAKEVLCRNGWEKMRYPKGTIGKWDDPEIVRCKDCYMYIMTDEIMGQKIHKTPFCKRLYRLVSDDWFCADGERQEGR